MNEHDNGPEQPPKGIVKIPRRLKRRSSNFGREVRTRRRALELTLEELSDRASIHPSTLSLIESGSRLPPEPPAVARLAVALGLDPEGPAYQRFAELAQEERAKRRKRRLLPPASPHPAGLIAEQGEDGAMPPCRILIRPFPGESSTLARMLKCLLEVECDEGISLLHVTSRRGRTYELEMEE